jgi:rhamnosyltransferase
MDQDSTASENMIEKLYKVIVSDDSIAIASPYHYMKNDKFTASKEAFTETLCVMTSGNLLNLEIYKAIGPFLDELFIDFVDVEYCLRIKRNKYKTVVVNDALLTHELGSIVKHGRFSTTNHSAIRRYYITRNRFYVCSKYKKDFKEYYHHQRKQFLKETVKIILWEKDKGEKISATIKGIRDYINKNMGQKIK